MFIDELSMKTQDSQASHDFIHYDSDPTPDVNDDEPNSHGTECAGVVGMKQNSIFGVGVAYNTSIGCESAESFKGSDTCTYIITTGILPNCMPCCSVKIGIFLNVFQL